MRFLKLISVITLFLSTNALAEDNMQLHPTSTHQYATFAGGCFWCIQPAFDSLEGVTKTTVGYSGGSEGDANYEAVSSHETEHKEAIQIEYDPTKVTYTKLLERFMHNIDPTDAEGQFADKGPQYHTAIYYHNEEQKKQAEEFFKKLEQDPKFKGNIKTEIIPYKNFYSAEEYHQKYYQKNATHYNLYKYGSGRVSKLKQIWGDEDGGH